MHFIDIESKILLHKHFKALNFNNWIEKGIRVVGREEFAWLDKMTRNFCFTCDFAWIIVNAHVWFTCDFHRFSNSPFHTKMQSAQNSIILSTNISTAWPALNPILSLSLFVVLLYLYRFDCWSILSIYRIFSVNFSYLIHLFVLRVGICCV